MKIEFLNEAAGPFGSYKDKTVVSKEDRREEIKKETQKIAKRADAGEICKAIGHALSELDFAGFTSDGMLDTETNKVSWYTDFASTFSTSWQKIPMSEQQYISIANCLYNSKEVIDHIESRIIIPLGYSYGSSGRQCFYALGSDRFKNAVKTFKNAFLSKLKSSGMWPAHIKYPKEVMFAWIPKLHTLSNDKARLILDMLKTGSYIPLSAFAEGNAETYPGVVNFTYEEDSSDKTFNEFYNALNNYIYDYRGVEIESIDVKSKYVSNAKFISFINGITSKNMQIKCISFNKYPYNPYGYGYTEKDKDDVKSINEAITIYENYKKTVDLFKKKINAVANQIDVKSPENIYREGWMTSIGKKIYDIRLNSYGKDKLSKEIQDNSAIATQSLKRNIFVLSPFDKNIHDYFVDFAKKIGNGTIKGKYEDIIAEQIADSMQKSLTKLLTLRPQCVVDDYLLFCSYHTNGTAGSDIDNDFSIGVDSFELKDDKVIFVLKYDFKLAISSGINSKYRQTASQSPSAKYYEYISGKKVKVVIPIK